MILATSEKSIVDDDTKISQMGETAVVTKEKDLSLSKSVDLTEFAYPNRELVNFENASVNIDNSNDVIIGPVTQFNVNGNVTIVQGGNGEELDEENAVKGKSSAAPYGTAKLQKTEKSSFEDQELKFFIKNKKILKTVVAIVTSLIFVVAITAVVINQLNSDGDVSDFNVPPSDKASNLGRHQVLTKKDWLGREAKSSLNITSPVGMVIIKHTGGGTCKNFPSCAGKVQTIQGMNIADGMSDIYCNFLIGGDGNIYVGRGWDVQNLQRDSTIDIVFMGSFDIDVFTSFMAEAAILLIEHGVKNNKLVPNYKIVCHNQTASLRSPGQNIFKEVVKWPHYDSGLYFPIHLEKTTSSKR